MLLRSTAAVAAAAADADQRRERRRRRDAVSDGAAALRPRAVLLLFLLLLLAGVIDAVAVAPVGADSPIPVQDVVERRGAAGGDETHDAAQPNVIRSAAAGAA